MLFRCEKFAQAGFTDGRKGTVEVRQYIDNMDVCMAAADLVIGRAGASSLSEIEAMGKASISGLDGLRMENMREVPVMQKR